MSSDTRLHLNLRWQELARDVNGYTVWQRCQERRSVRAEETGLLLCDVWDSHWSRGAVKRLEAILPQMDAVVTALRAAGAQIIHAPSDTMDYYADHPSRLRIMAVPSATPPPELPHDDPPLPVDASDHGSDTGETETHRAWSREHPGIAIDAERDVISDRGTEVYAWLRAKGIGQLLVMGVHTNMCVLNRSFAIKQMVRWGVDTALVRDLTDAMYNPARPPYVSHAEGTRLVVEYIEKFWCPTVQSDDLL
jgi:nicotinamidase-related amidase